MPDKTTDSHAAIRAAAAISQGGVIEVTGKDAIAFAQAQCMNDVALLTDGAWQWSGWLSAKGRVIALFALIRLDVGRICLWLPDFPADELARRLRRFVFRSKVEIIARPELRAVAMFDPPPGALPASPCRVARSPEHGVVLDLGGEGGSRWLCLTGHADPAIDARADHACRLLDLRHGFPRLGAGDSEAYTAHMLSLPRLSAFSVRKGCYPGQEIVSRTHYLGQAKRGLVRLHGNGPIAPGDAVDAGGQTVASVLNTVASADGSFEALAVMPHESDRDLTVSGRPVIGLPMLNGLGRSGQD